MAVFIVISIVSLLLSITLGVLAAVLLGRDIDSTKKSADSCKSDKQGAIGSSCVVWDSSGKMCRKGKWKKQNGKLECYAKGDPFPLVCAIGSSLFGILFLVFLIIGLVKMTKSS